MCIFKKSVRFIATGLICSAMMCGSVFSNNQTGKYTSPKTRIVKDVWINDTRLTEIDKIILGILRKHDRTGNTLAVHTENQKLFVFASGGSDDEARSAVQDIKNAIGNNIDVKSIGLEDIMGEVVGEISQIINTCTANAGDVPLSTKLKARLRALKNRANLPDAYQIDLMLIECLDRYAHDVYCETLDEVYGQTKNSNLSERSIVGNDYAKWHKLAKYLRTLDDSKLREALKLILNALDFRNAIQSGDQRLQLFGNNIKDDAMAGISWIKRALHTEIQLQWYLRARKLTLSLDKPILSAYRPCLSCAATPAVRHWCQEPSRTPFYCSKSDQQNHELDKTDMTKAGEIKNGNTYTGNIYLVTLEK